MNYLPRRLPDGGPPLVVPAQGYFRDVAEGLRRLFRDLGLTEERFGDLAREFRSTFPDSRLQLFPWRRRKHLPPTPSTGARSSGTRPSFRPAVAPWRRADAAVTSSALRTR